MTTQLSIDFDVQVDKSKLESHPTQEEVQAELDQLYAYDPDENWWNR